MKIQECRVPIYRVKKQRKAYIETKKIPAAQKWNHRETPLSGR